MFLNLFVQSFLPQQNGMGGLREAILTSQDYKQELNEIMSVKRSATLQRVPGWGLIM